MSRIDLAIADHIDAGAPPPGLDWPERAGLRALRKQELAIARRFYGGPAALYTALAFVQFGVWLALFGLTMTGRVSPFLACPLATLICIGGFITGHEAMHGNLKPGAHPARGLNAVVGVISLLPLVIPFSMGRLTHGAHHTHCNDPERDPDCCDAAPNAWAALIKTWYNRQPGVPGVTFHYRRVLQMIGTPEALAAERMAVMYQFGFVGVLSVLAWSGHALTAALVWWLPRQLALSYIRFTFSWAPHHPRENRGSRYTNTRVFGGRIGNLLSMGMQYHIIHHLYPNILIHRTRPAFAALREVLEARGVDCSAQPRRKER